MGNPVVQYSIEDIPKRAGTLGMERVHDRLAFVVKTYEKKPGKAEEKNETIQDQERRKSRFFGFFARPIEPEDLGENHKGNGAITGIK